jgi:hypothetical protein
LPDAAQRAELKAGLRGAFMLIRGKPDGIALMPVSARGAALSFWAMVLCLPLFLVLRLVLGETPFSTRTLVAELSGFVAGWVGYALATLPMALAAQRGPLWPRFLATYNWISLLQYGLILALSVVSGGLPSWAGQGIELAILGYALWLQWFATGLALKITGARAAGFVLLDLVLGLMLSSIVADLSGR